MNCSTCKHYEMFLIVKMGTPHDDCACDVCWRFNLKDNYERLSCESCLHLPMKKEIKDGRVMYSEDKERFPCLVCGGFLE